MYHNYLKLSLFMGNPWRGDGSDCRTVYYMAVCHAEMGLCITSSHGTPSAFRQVCERSVRLQLQAAAVWPR